MNACLVTCNDLVKDEDGHVIEVHCTYDPDSLGGQAPDRRRVKGTLHWVSAEKYVEATANLYENLFTVENPSDVPVDGDFRDNLNPNSKLVLANVKLEAAMADAKPGDRYQFMRQGFFYLDPESTTEDQMVFNRIVPLRDSWAKISKKG
jgi:glutaminyl-tRNA synthetase